MGQAQKLASRAFLPVPIPSAAAARRWFSFFSPKPPPALARCKNTGARESGTPRRQRRRGNPSPEPTPLRSPHSGCPDRHGEDDDDAAAGLRAGVAGAAQLRGRGPLRPRQVPRPRRRPPRLHHTEGGAHLFSLPPSPGSWKNCRQHNLKLNCVSSLFSLKFLFGRLFSVRTCLKIAMWASKLSVFDGMLTILGLFGRE